jgi:hypothetical protein
MNANIQKKVLTIALLLTTLPLLILELFQATVIFIGIITAKIVAEVLRKACRR